jgi:hypothetical protein
MVCPNVEIPYFINAKLFGFSIPVGRNELLRNSLDTKGQGDIAQVSSPRSVSANSRHKSFEFSRSNMGVLSEAPGSGSVGAQPMETVRQLSNSRDKSQN